MSYGKHNKLQGQTRYTCAQGCKRIHPEKSQGREKSAADIAEEHGVTRSAVYRWLKEETGGESNPLIGKLQKENQLLKQLVAELSLKIRESEKRGW